MGSFAKKAKTSTLILEVQSANKIAVKQIKKEHLIDALLAFFIIILMKYSHHRKTNKDSCK